MTARCLKCKQPFRRSPDEAWKTLCVRCWYAGRASTGRKSSSAGSKSSTGPKLPPRAVDEFSDRLREMIQLCHPDRHGGSELAGQVTQWLLRVRKELRP